MELSQAAAEALVRPSDLSAATLVGSTAGLRLSGQRTHHGRLPFAQRSPRDREVWLGGGLGARGLLRHAQLGEWLAAAILADDDSLIPNELKQLRN